MDLTLTDFVSDLILYSSVKLTHTHTHARTHARAGGDWLNRLNIGQFFNICNILGKKNMSEIAQ
jgi:hypothetical protein